VCCVGVVPVPVIVCVVGEFAASLANDTEAEVAPLACGVNVTVNPVDWPAFNVTGREIPESTNSPLVELAELIVTDAPLAVRLPFKDELDPTVTFPKLKLVGDTASWPAEVPVPESAIVSVEFDAFDTIARLPLTAPAPEGVKVAVNVTLWFAARLRGNDNPLMVKAAPVTLACEIVTLEPPVLVTVSERLALLPTCTLPNPSEEGFGDKVPCVAPVPDKGMLKLGFEPLDVMVTVPLADPLALGAKTTVNDVLWPALNVKGRLRPLRLKPLPLAAAAEIVRLEPPLLVKVSDKLELFPTCTVPNAKLVGFADRVPCVTPVPESGMLRLEFEPLEVTVTLPFAAPLAVGENNTVNEVLWPAPNVKGRLSPLRLKPLPLALAAEIVKLVPPELVSVSVSDLEVPS
jgi:hypothetical protein